jgi:hypothetical protein
MAAIWLSGLRHLYISVGSVAVGCGFEPPSLARNYSPLKNITVKMFASVLFSRMHSQTYKHELKTRENFNSNALTIKFLQQMRNFVYRY